MKIRELRIRYEIENSAGRKVEHGIVCTFDTVKAWLDKAKAAEYKVVGIDERFRNENERIPANEGWTPKYFPVEVQ